jgi:diacylglycerol kinase (ATP)
MTLTLAPNWVAIVNPRSGGRVMSNAFEQRLDRIVDRVLVSERAGHVDALVRSCRDAAGILVIGGDGTLFEVLQACDRSRQKIAVLPAGRGNSLAKDLGIADKDGVVDCMAHGIDRAIDLLDVTLRHEDGSVWRGVSASNLAIGYPAEVARGAARWRRLGTASYAVATLAAPAAVLHARLQCDDEAEASASVTGLIISNSRYVGPFLGFPSSSLFDGVCHTIEMRAGRIRQTLHNFSSLTGLGFYEPGVRKDVRSISIDLDAPALLKIDGELRTGVQEIRVRLLRSAATFRVPGASHG